MRRPRTCAFLLIAALVVPRPLTAQDAPLDPPSAPTTARSAVAKAKNAFEYRDFERVVSLLYPWLHPRRILEPAVAVDARRLLGVSLHVLGRVEEAREEFAELLLLDPRHKLDPFLVPPPVMETFDAVRTSLRPTLDEILLAQGQRPPPTLEVERPTDVRAVEVPPLVVALLPVGIPQFAADEMGWGLLWAVLQVGFLALNAVAFDQAGRNDDGGFSAWTGVQFGALAGFLGSWTASSLQGYRQLRSYRERAVKRAVTPETSPARGAGPAAPSLSLGLRF